MQFSQEDMAREIARVERHYDFLWYALMVAWLALVVYVLMMVARERKLRREIASLRAMLEDKR